MEVFEILYKRQSVRKYKPDKIDQGLLDEILNFSNGLLGIIEDIKVEFKLIDNSDNLKGFYGPLSVMAPYYLCIASEVKDDYLINVGYLMQEINLFLNSKGLGACFLGSGIPSKAEKPNFKYKYILNLAFGVPEKDLFREPSKAKRLDHNKLALFKEEPLPQIKEIVEAGIFAPSHVNMQPWRFVVYNNRIHIFSKNPGLLASLDSRHIDIGIALANMFLIAEKHWIPIKITRSRTLENNDYKKNLYILTLLLDSKYAY